MPPGTASERKVLQKMVNRHSYYNKDLSWSHNPFKERHCEGKVMFVRKISQKMTWNEEVTSIYAHKKNVKSLKYSSEEVPLLVILQTECQ